jgi:chaperone BCS1
MAKSAHTNADRIGLRPFFFSRSGGSRSSGSALGMTLNTRGEVQNALTITTLGWSLVPLVKFADLCHEFHLKNQAGTTTIHLAGSGGDQYGGEWQSISKAIRKLDTIDMDEDIKLDVVKDAEHYYSVQS